MVRLEEVYLRLVEELEREKGERRGEGRGNGKRERRERERKEGGRNGLCNGVFFLGRLFVKCDVFIMCQFIPLNILPRLV